MSDDIHPRANEGQGSSEQSETPRTSITLPITILVRGRLRAQGQHRSFSNYIQHLIARDVENAAPAEQEQEQAGGAA